MAGGNPVAFLRQSIKDFRNTGALAPSGLFLARALAKTLPVVIDDNFKVLEVGPGTGSVTAEISSRMNGKGHLDLWEISPAFCEVLRKRIAQDPKFHHMRSRVHVHEGDIRQLAPGQHFNTIISGLPFNNFEPEEVRGFLEHFRTLLRPEGTLVWFEYVAIRKIQSPFVGKACRKRLEGIGKVTGSFVRAYQYKQQIIPINFPPARIRQAKFA